MLLYPTDLIGEVNVLSDVEEFRKPLFEEMSGWVKRGKVWKMFVYVEKLVESLEAQAEDGNE